MNAGCDCQQCLSQAHVKPLLSPTVGGSVVRQERVHSALEPSLSWEDGQLLQLEVVSLLQLADPGVDVLGPPHLDGGFAPRVAQQVQVVDLHGSF